jgi:serine/threonine-protein kinase
MDERTDIFGLGALLYEILTNRLPYGAEPDPEKLIAKAKAGQVVPVEVAAEKAGLAHRIASSQRLFRIINKCIAPKPEDRFQTVLELQNAVRAFLRGGLHLPRKEFQPGEVIISEGQEGDAAYLIVSGECRATRTTPGGEEELGTMTAGDVFGEMALVLAEPRAATVVAKTATTLMVLDKRTLQEGLGLDSWTGALVHALAKRFRALEQTVRDSGLKR